MLFFIYHEYQDWMSLDIQQEETKDSFVDFLFSKSSSRERRRRNSAHLIMIIMQMSIA
jgi:hypothetical protein